MGVLEGQRCLHHTYILLVRTVHKPIQMNTKCDIEIHLILVQLAHLLPLSAGIDDEIFMSHTNDRTHCNRHCHQRAEDISQRSSSKWHSPFVKKNIERKTETNLPCKCIFFAASKQKILQRRYFEFFLPLPHRVVRLLMGQRSLCVGLFDERFSIVVFYYPFVNKRSKKKNVECTMEQHNETRFELVVERQKVCGMRSHQQQSPQIQNPFSLTLKKVGMTTAHERKQLREIFAFNA